MNLSSYEVAYWSNTYVCVACCVSPVHASRLSRQIFFEIRVSTGWIWKLSSDLWHRVVWYKGSLVEGNLLSLLAVRNVAYMLVCLVKYTSLSPYGMLFLKLTFQKRRNSGALSQNWEKRMLASSCLSVCLSAWNNSAPTGRIFLKFDIWVFFENRSRKFKFH